MVSRRRKLNKLGDEIGIDIELLSTEAKTGSFSTDILAVYYNMNIGPELKMKLNLN